MKFEIAIFSFNRARLLENATMSALFCAPNSPVTIFDDDSDDMQTQKTIARLKNGYSVKVIQPRKRAYGTRGGLHQNIRTFILDHSEADFVLLMQDDTQFFRPLSELDFTYVREFFAKNENSCFLYPVINRKPKPRHTTTVKRAGVFEAWFRTKGVYAGYSDIVIVARERLMEKPNVLGGSEEETSKRASDVFGPVAHMDRPFLTFLPAPETIRKKSDTITSRRWRRNNTGVFPVAYMPKKQVEKMVHAAQTQLPNATDWLSCPAYKGRDWPAFYLQGAPKWLRLLDRVELKIREIIHLMLRS